MTISHSPSRVLWPLGIAVTLSLFGDLTLYAVLVTQLSVVGFSLAAAGVMLGVNRLVRIPGNPVGGLLLDRWGRRRLFLLGMALGAISTLAYAFVYGFWPFLAARLLWGAAWVLINVGGMTMALDVSNASNRGRVLGVYNTWVLLGLAAGPLAGGFLVDALGFRTAMMICAGLTAAGFVVAWVALPETSSASERLAGRSWRQRLALKRIAARFSILPTLRQGSALAIAALLFMIVMFVGEGITLSTISLLLQQQFGHSAALDGWMIGVAALGGLFLGLRSLLAGAAGPLAGHLSDRRGARKPLIGLGLLLGALGFTLLAYAASLLWIAVAIVLLATGGGAAQAVLAALAGDAAPAHRQGMVMGAFATAGDIGSMAGPFVAFALAAWVGLRPVYLLSAGLLLLGLWLLRYIRA
ncbi:MAG: MFS transporter [Chloroflexi bacterium]|nr:MFS transporter [Chloroflexota bacterium]